MHKDSVRSEAAFSGLRDQAVSVARRTENAAGLHPVTTGSSAMIITIISSAFQLSLTATRVSSLSDSLIKPKL